MLRQFENSELPTYLFPKRFKSTSEHGAGEVKYQLNDIERIHGIDMPDYLQSNDLCGIVIIGNVIFVFLLYNIQ